MVQIKPVFKILGVLSFIIGLFILTALPIAIIYNEDPYPILISSFISLIVGISLFTIFYKHKKTSISKRDGCLIVTLGWVTMVFFGSLPFIFSNVLETMSSAFFESASGFTTTGISAIKDVEIVPKNIIFWRSLTQFIGGMGIIVLTVAIMPLIGIGGIELFVAEAKGGAKDKIHPKIKETAKIFCLIFTGLNALLTLVLWFEGMSFFDAINHSFTCISTAGFSTKNASIDYFNSPLIDYTIILFMFIGGTNVTVIYYFLTGKFKKVWSSDEFKTYLFFIFGISIILGIFVNNILGGQFEQNMRDVLFQVVSVLTTTGYVTANYTEWHPSISAIFFLLMFVGGCAGSTAGGIKFVRHVTFVKNSLLEFKRLLHPMSVIRIKLDKEIVAPRILTQILVFLLLYIMTFIIGTLVMLLIMPHLKDPLITAGSAVATSMGNVGVGLGDLNPLENFAKVPDIGKLVLSFLMIAGRLELFSVFIIFSPYYWKV